LRNASPRDSLGACLQCEKVEEEEGIQYPSLGGYSWTFYGPKWAVAPPYWFRPATNQQAKLAGKAAKKTKILGKFLLEQTRNFLCKNQQV
jgi:hypothetical protein